MNRAGERLFPCPPHDPYSASAANLILRIKTTPFGPKPNGVFFITFYLIVFRADFKISLWMSACRAYFRCLFSNNDVSAIPALPNLDSASFEYFLSLYIMQQCAVALLVMLLYLPYHAELCRQLENLPFPQYPQILHTCQSTHNFRRQRQRPSFLP